MHLVLQNQELLSIICQNITNYDLTTLARVQKGIGNVALDVLWEDIELGSLLRLFSPGVIISNDSGEEAFARSPPNTDWDRFDRYAARVRTLQRQIDYAIDFENVLYFLRPRRHILPNLQHLIWPDASVYELLGLSTFFVPSLRTVDISAVYLPVLPVNPRHPTSLFYNQAVEATLLELVDLGVSLRKFRMPILENKEESLPTLYHPRWALLIRNGLVEVKVVPSGDILNALSVVQTLEVLTLQFHSWSNATHELDKTPGDFPVLKALHILGIISLSDGISLLDITGCVPSDTIDIECSRTPSGHKFSELVDTILRSGRSRSLQIFSLVTGSDSLDENGDLLVDTIVTMDHIRPLLQLELRGFMLDIAYPLSMTDDNLKELTSAWSGLQYLCLPSSFRVSSMVSPEHAISLHGLRHLAYCARLSYATLFLRVNQEDVQSLPKVVSICPLSELRLGNSKIPDGLAVPLACFLVHLFPKIQFVGSIGPGRSGWVAVSKGIGYVQAFKERGILEL